MMGFQNTVYAMSTLTIGFIISLSCYSTPNPTESAIAEELVRFDIETARQKALEIQDPDIRDTALRTAAFSMIQTPRKAAEWTIKVVPEIRTRRKIFSEIFPAWRKQNPDELTAWLGQISEVAAKEGLTIMNALLWAKEDPIAALDWIQQFPDSRFRNQCFLPVLFNYSNVEPERATTWVLNNLPDDDFRFVALHQTLAIWLSYDYDPATDWMKTKLSRKEREKVEKKFADNTVSPQNY